MLVDPGPYFLAVVGDECGGAECSAVAARLLLRFLGVLSAGPAARIEAGEE